MALLGIFKWTDFREAKPFPFDGANLVGTFLRIMCISYSKTPAFGI